MASNQSDYPIQFSVDYPDQPAQPPDHALPGWILILPVYLLGLLVTSLHQAYRSSSCCSFRRKLP